MRVGDSDREAAAAIWSSHRRAAPTAAATASASSPLPRDRSGAVEPIGARRRTAAADRRATAHPRRWWHYALAALAALLALVRTGALCEPGGPALDSIDGMRDAWRQAIRATLAGAGGVGLSSPRRHRDADPRDPGGTPGGAGDVDDAGDSAPVRWGLVHLTDAESGRSRSLLMRPALSRRIERETLDHGERIAALMRVRQLGRSRPRPPFNPSQLTDYFHRGSPWRAVAPADAAAGPDTTRVPPTAGPEPAIRPRR